jgi:hypothetical protein
VSDNDDTVAEAMAGRRPNKNGKARANCPFCIFVDGKPDRRQSLSLDSATGWWSCFRCDTRGRLPHSEELVTLAPVVVQEREAIELPPHSYPLWKEPGLTAYGLTAARDYLATRGVSPEVIESAQLAACARGKFAGRIIVPIYRADGRLGGYAGRAWGFNRMRYLYGEGTDRSTLLYNEAALHVETDEPVLAVEGTFDSFPYWPNVVAFLGKPAGTQLAILAKAKRPVVIALDGDAWLEGWAACMQLSLKPGFRVGCLRLPPRTDPADDPAWVREQIPRALA